MIEFFVSGVPVPQGSKRHVGNGRMIESSRRLKPWRDRVICVAKQEAEVLGGPLTGPLTVGAHFFFERPKRSKFEDPIGRGIGDGDKLTRAVWDALTLGGLIADDALVCSWYGSKRWADFGGPGVLVEVEAL